MAATATRPEFLTATDAAARLRLSTGTIRAARRKGHLWAAAELAAAELDAARTGTMGETWDTYRNAGSALITAAFGLASDEGQVKTVAESEAFYTHPAVLRADILANELAAGALDEYGQSASSLRADAAKMRETGVHFVMEPTRA